MKNKEKIRIPNENLDFSLRSKIKKIVKEFFEKMGFEVEIENEELRENTLSLSMKTNDPQILIGAQGKTLVEIQKVLGKMIRKKIGEQIFVDLDINQYKKNKTLHLKELAQSLADEVSLSKEEKILFPMSSYERRIVHLEIAKREDVKTESVGQEPERRIVIKPT